MSPLTLRTPPDFAPEAPRDPFRSSSLPRFHQEQANRLRWLRFLVQTDLERLWRLPQCAWQVSRRIGKLPEKLKGDPVKFESPPAPLDRPPTGADLRAGLLPRCGALRHQWGRFMPHVIRFPRALTANRQIVEVTPAEDWQYLVDATG